MSMIWGDRVGLRKFEDRMSDAEIARLYRWSTDEQVLRWSGGSPTGLSEEDFADQLRGERLYGPSNRRAFLIFTREDLQLIGRLGIFGIDWDKRQGELGIVIGEKEYWGHGYGRDAIATLLRHIFSSSSLQRVYLYTFANNLRAQRCFTAAGFQVVDRSLRYTPELGEFDGVQMQVLRADFLQRDVGRKVMSSELFSNS
jgi:RimJ/RimL family protein N-acetyltransferase